MEQIPENLAANNCKNPNGDLTSTTGLLNPNDLLEMCQRLTIMFGADYVAPNGELHQKAKLIFQMAIAKKLSSGDLRKVTESFIDNQIYPEWTPASFFNFYDLENTEMKQQEQRHKSIVRLKLESIENDSLVETPDGKGWLKVANGFYLGERFAPFGDFEKHYDSWKIRGVKSYD